MNQHPFIFSDEPKYRLRRHISFWVLWWLFMAWLYGYVPYLFGLQDINRFLISFIDAFFFLAAHMFMAYTLMYFVIPRYLVKGRYAMSALSVAIICFLTACISAFIAMVVLDRVHELCFSEVKNIPYKSGYRTVWLSLLAGLRGGITIGGLAAAIKLMKYWYLKQQRYLQLQKENAESQLQLLKAQVHPHFLFNTLNNIYSHTQGLAPVASKLALGLSDMLRFMIYECNQPQVSLTKELKLINDYITLEKIRYDERLDIHVDIPQDTGDLCIAPLLLLPFVENCFKHGTSHMIDQPWLSLRIEIYNDTMYLKLVNGKVPIVIHNHKAGIGIDNVRKRLGLIYPGKHELVITDDTDVFVVNLSLQLERKPGFVKKQPAGYVLMHE